MASSGGGASPGGGAQQGGGPGRAQVQRRVLADGRVINFIDNPNRPGDMTVVDDSDDPGRRSRRRAADDASAVRRARGGPARAPGMMPGGDPDQTDNQPAPVQTPSAAPTMPTRTLPTPGVIPAAKPAPGQPGAPGPPKPPGY